MERQQITESSYPVIGPDFCAPCAFDLAICRKFIGGLVVKKEDGMIFKVKNHLFSLRFKQTISDADGNPIVTLRPKIMTTHYTWKAFRGKSTDAKDLIFTAKATSMIQPFRTTLKVFLANKTSKDVCDYKVKGSWFERKCDIYKGESSTIVAQMRKMLTLQSLLLDMDKLMVTVSPNFDYAFVASLILILDVISKHKVVRIKKILRAVGLFYN